LLLVFLPRGWRQGTRLLVGWDFATGLSLVLAMAMMARSTVANMHRRAALQDSDQVVVLGLISFTALVSLVAIMADLSTAKSMKGPGEWRHIALAGLTVFLSWTFMHTIFTIHYAHEYYGGEDANPDRGLEFPGHESPDYWDFLECHEDS
jgi:uncharacterized membrane protein